MKLYKLPQATQAQTLQTPTVISSHYLDHYLDRFAVWLVSKIHTAGLAGGPLYFLCFTGLLILAYVFDWFKSPQIGPLTFYLFAILGGLLPCSACRYARLCKNNPPTPRQTDGYTGKNLAPFSHSIWIVPLSIILLLMFIDHFFEFSNTWAQSGTRQLTATVHDISMLLLYIMMAGISALFGTVLGSHITTSQWIRRLLHADSPSPTIAMGFSLLRAIFFLCPLTGLTVLWLTWPTTFHWLPTLIGPAMIIWCFYWWISKEIPIPISITPTAYVRKFRGGGKRKRSPSDTRTTTHETV